MNIEISDEVVRAAQNYARTHHAYEGGDRTPATTTAHDLAAHSLAALLAERVLDADTRGFLQDFAEASRAMVEAERELEHQQRFRRRRYR